MAIGVGLYHGPSPGTGDGFSGRSEISVHRSNVGDGDEWSGHQEENSEKRNTVEWNNPHFTGRRSGRDKRRTREKVEIGFHGIKQAAFVLAISLQINVPHE